MARDYSPSRLLQQQLFILITWYRFYRFILSTRYKFHRLFSIFSLDCTAYSPHAMWISQFILHTKYIFHSLFPILSIISHFILRTRYKFQFILHARCKIHSFCSIPSVDFIVYFPYSLCYSGGENE